MKIKKNISERMKRYEKVSSISLTRRIPIIIRIDGRSFHTLTRKYFERKWSPIFTGLMAETAKHVMKDMQGCDFCYCQSDEISFLLTDYKTIQTEPWFDYDLSKIISTSASLASTMFSNLLTKPLITDINDNFEIATFDSRAFSIPHDEVCNYFIWRQQDATRNSIQMLGREYFSHKELQNKSCDDIQDLLFKEKNINFNDIMTVRKRGFCITSNTERNLDENKERLKMDFMIPIFSKFRDYIERFVNIRND